MTTQYAHIFAPLRDIKLQLFTLVTGDVCRRRLWLYDISKCFGNIVDSSDISFKRFQTDASPAGQRCVISDGSCGSYCALLRSLGVCASRPIPNCCCRQIFVCHFFALWSIKWTGHVPKPRITDPLIQEGILVNVTFVVNSFVILLQPKLMRIWLCVWGSLLMEVDSRFYTLLLIMCEDGLIQSIPEPVGTGQISMTAQNKSRFLWELQLQLTSAPHLCSGHFHL